VKLLEFLDLCINYGKNVNVSVRLFGTVFNAVFNSRLEAHIDLIKIWFFHERFSQCCVVAISMFFFAMISVAEKKI
jgi:hypothetical protein